MKLSVYMIYDSIASDGSYLIANGIVNFNLYGVRYYSNSSSKMSEELIYIIKAEELLNIQSNDKLTFICLGEIDRELLDENWSVIVLSSNKNIHKIFEQVQENFEKYRSWRDDINKSIFNKEPLQSILDKSSINLRNPVALFDNCQGLLIKSGNLGSSKLDYIWSFVLEKGYSLNETEGTVLKQKVNLSRKPFYYNSPDIHRKIKRLIAPIYIDDTYFGVLAMTELNAPFSESEYANLCIIQDIVQNALKVSNEYLISAETPWFLHRLVVGKYIDTTIISYHLSLVGRKVKEKFFLWCFSLHEDEDDGDKVIKKYLNHLSIIFKSSITFYHENVILVCDYDLNHYENMYFQKTIQDFLIRTKLKASKSMIFNDIFEIYFAFKQCKIANEYGRNDNLLINSFKSKYSEYILSSIEKNIRLEVLVSSDIRLFDPVDINHKELLHTLQAYIINGRNLSATAKNLNIHRHTVVYRLNKIVNITGLDLDNIDEDTLFYLYLSCKILLRNISKEN